MTPHVYVLILNWNGKDILYDCVKSIFNSNYRNYKITIIDNGSTDNSIDKVKQAHIYMDKGIHFGKIALKFE